MQLLILLQNTPGFHASLPLPTITSNFNLDAQFKETSLIPLPTSTTELKVPQRRGVAIEERTLWTLELLTEKKSSQSPLPSRMIICNLRKQPRSGFCSIMRILSVIGFIRNQKTGP